MLNLGITIRGYLKSCGPFQLPELKVECIGSGCGAILDPSFCDSSLTCTAGTECIDVYDEIFNMANTSAADFIGAFFSLNLTEPDQCSTEANGRRFIRNAIQHVKGVALDQGTNTKICLVNFTAQFEDFNFTTWAKAQATVDGDNIILHTLSEWVYGTPYVPPPQAAIEFNIQGNPNAVIDVIEDAYPNADVSVRTEGAVTIITIVAASTPSEPADQQVQTIASDLQNPGSTLNTEITRGGATVVPGSISRPENIVAPNNRDSASSLSIATAVIVAAVARLF
jgi:hypothetical protein